MFEAFSAKMRETRAYRGDAHEPSAAESASVASLLLTTECMVAEKPEEKGANQPQMPPGGMM
jgi:hypothetical protein